MIAVGTLAQQRDAFKPYWPHSLNTFISPRASILVSFSLTPALIFLISAKLRGHISGENNYYIPHPVCVTLSKG